MGRYLTYKKVKEILCNRFCLDETGIDDLRQAYKEGGFLWNTGDFYESICSWMEHGSEPCYDDFLQKDWRVCNG